MTCPSCGARTTPRASWCTLCLTPLDAAAEPPPPSPPSTTPGTDADAAPAADAERGFRTRDGEVEWRCPDCDTWNWLAVPTCAVCGSAMPGTQRAGSWSPDRVARTRRALWVVAGVVCLLAVVGIVVGLVAARGAG